MSSTLHSVAVQEVLAELRELGALEDPPARRRIWAREAELGHRVYGGERAELGALAPQAVTPEAGQLLYALALAARPRLAVEFGTSLGVSALYLASALADLGTGRLVTTELVASKAQRAGDALAAAGLDDLVDIRTGDALETLAELRSDIDLLFLDGSNNLYLAVLDLLEPWLTARAVVVADMSAGDPHHDRYREYVETHFVTTEIAVDAGLVVSVRGG